MNLECKFVAPRRQEVDRSADIITSDKIHIFPLQIMIHLGPSRS